MTDEIPTAAARVAESLPVPANSNAPGAVNVDRAGNQVIDDSADPAPAGGRSGRAKAPAPSPSTSQAQE